MGTQGERRTRAAGEMVRQSGDVRVGSDALRTQLLSKIRIELDAAQSRLARARARHCEVGATHERIWSEDEVRSAGAVEDSASAVQSPAAATR